MKMPNIIRLTDQYFTVPALTVLIAGLAIAPIGNGVPALAQEPAHASAWISEHATRARLVGGGVAQAQGKTPALIAGLEIQLDDGWKTYWRNPGSSGVPPRFDFTGSDNVASATALYPAPARLKDRDGDTIGYKTAVVFPIEIKPVDATKPVTLKLAAEYGVCKDVCIPVQPALSLTLPQGAAAKSAGPDLAQALERVPRSDAQLRPTDPKLKSLKIDLASAKPSITIDAQFPGDSSGADVFLEAPDGIWIPLAKSAGAVAGGVGRFTVDLTDGADLADLKGRMIRLTLVSASGQSETTFKLE